MSRITRAFEIACEIYREHGVDPVQVIETLKKIPVVLHAWQERVFLHISRGVRWDSDHVVLLNDEVLSIAREAAVYGYLDRIFFCLDYFDGSINRIASMVIGARNMQKALLIALLEPTHLLREEENKWDFTARMVRQEEIKTLPWSSVWNYCCESNGMPDDFGMMNEINAYEKAVLFNRR